MPATARAESGTYPTRSSQHVINPHRGESLHPRREHRTFEKQRASAATRMRIKQRVPQLSKPVRFKNEAPAVESCAASPWKRARSIEHRGQKQHVLDQTEQLYCMSNHAKTQNGRALLPAPSDSLWRPSPFYDAVTLTMVFDAAIAAEPRSPIPPTAR